MNFSEQRVIAFLAAALANSLLPDGAFISVSVKPMSTATWSFFGSVKIYDGSYKYIDSTGKTVSEAAAKFLAQMPKPKTKAERAHELRNEAQALIAKAVELEQEVQQ